MIMSRWITPWDSHGLPAWQSVVKPCVSFRAWNPYSKKIHHLVASCYAHSMELSYLDSISKSPVDLGQDLVIEEDGE
ncbi:hypothetical protein Tco_1069914 [Tanacetum coccineum]|uniref:Uncharacterized protein n=1 Tax=Tanacetum coccineum TaxID=301880 RepID=A0ABQ5HLT6_9ASTR